MRTIWELLRRPEVRHALIVIAIGLLEIIQDRRHR